LHNFENTHTKRSSGSEKRETCQTPQTNETVHTTTVALNFQCSLLATNCPIILSVPIQEWSFNLDSPTQMTPFRWKKRRLRTPQKAWPSPDEVNQWMFQHHPGQWLASTAGSWFEQDAICWFTLRSSTSSVTRN